MHASSSDFPSAPRLRPDAKYGPMGHTAHGAVPGHLLSTLVPHTPEPQAIPVESAISLLLTRLCLTPRQAEVLHWIAEGKTNAEISIILGCGFSTVKKHVACVFQRLGVHSRTAAAAAAYRAHIAESEVLRSSAPAKH